MASIESKELRTFRSFLSAAKISAESFGEEPPPAPDILAVIDGESIAYELTEAVEPEYARKLDAMFKTPALVRTSFQQLPIQRQRTILGLHDRKVIDICFLDRVPLRERERSMPGVFQYLESLPAKSGMVELARFNQPLPGLDHIALQNIEWDEGIRWEAGAPAGFIDPESAILGRLHDKMTKKTYQTEHPIHLLVYSDREVTPPPNTGWEIALSQAAARLLAGSPFQQVWYFDTWTDSARKFAG